MGTRIGNLYGSLTPAKRRRGFGISEKAVTLLPERGTARQNASADSGARKPCPSRGLVLSGGFHRAASPRSEKSLNSRARCRDFSRSEEHTSELQSHLNLVCRLLLEKKNIQAWTACCSSASRNYSTDACIRT